MEGFPDKIDGTEGMSVVPGIDKDGQPDYGTRFWVRKEPRCDTEDGTFLDGSPTVDGEYGEGTVDKNMGRTPLDDLRDEVEGGMHD